MKKLSLCICFYNAEKHIERCIESLLSFLSDEIEVILVDDGSTDSSIILARNYFSKYNQFKLIELNKNFGISFARQTAIENSNGEYIIFLDSDDELISDPLGIIERNQGIDIIEFGTYFGELIINSIYGYNILIPPTEYLEDYFRMKHFYNLFCMRAIKRKLYIPNPFSNKLRIFEDNMALPILFNRASSIIVLNEVLVKVNETPNSITTKIYSENNKKNIQLKMSVKSKFYFEWYFHLINNLDEKNKGISFDRFLIQLAIYHAFYSISINSKERKSQKKLLLNKYKYKIVFRYTFSTKIKSNINPVLFLFGLRCTYLIVSLVSRLNISLNQVIKRI